MRLALDPEGRPFVDVLGRAPGRGVYVEPEALVEALGAKALGRAFRGKAQVPGGAEVEALLEATRARLEDRLLELLGLARRAGGLTLGMDASLDALARGRARVVVVARDLAERSRARVEAARSAVPVIEVGSVDVLGQALGREVVGVVVIEHAVFARRAVIEAERREKLPRGRSTDG